MKVNLTGHPLAANNYFYLGKKLYKILQVNRASDFLSAWNYVDHGVEEFVLSYIRKKAEPAFNTQAVAEMLERSVQTIYNDYINHNQIVRPIKTYPLDGTNRPRRLSRRYWSKDDVYRLYESYVEKHTVVNKKTGKIRVNNNRVQSRAELRAKLEQQVSYYVMDNKTGKMIKAYGAGD